MFSVLQAFRFGFSLILWLSATGAALGQSVPVIFTESGAATISANQSACFIVKATGSPTPAFHWQRLPVGGHTWLNISETEDYSGTETCYLRIFRATLDMSGDQFRCVATNSAGSGSSASMVLTVNPPVVSSRIIVKLKNEFAQGLGLAMSSTTDTVNIGGVAAIDRNLDTLLSRHAVRAVSPLFARKVRAKQRERQPEASIVSAIRQRFPARTARASTNATPPDLTGTFIFELGDRPAAEIAETVRSLRADANIVYAEEEKIARVQYIPNDPSYSTTGSWGQDYDDLYGLKKIGATQAWDVTHGQGVVVAVVDTGIDYNHPDIKDNIWINQGEIPGNGIDDDHNGYIDDVRGWDFVGSNVSLSTEDNNPIDGHYHGTHVAGTIAAIGDNNLGVVGIAWKAKVMAVKGLDDNGAGREADLARAIIYAVDNGADVINASWGGSGTSQTIADAIDYAHAMGVVFVVAAGNDNADASGYFPANAANAITVASLAPNDAKSTFSNFGYKIELAAPGEDILSLQAGATGYSRLSGTSMATPHVSGVVALIIAQYPTYTNEQVRQALHASATDLGLPGKDSSFGYGRVNAAQGVLVNDALETKILSPLNGMSISASPSLTGTVSGSGLDHYIVDFGSGSAPEAWTVLRNSTTSVSNGDIGTLDISALAEGTYTVRLRAFATGGSVFTDQIQVRLRYVELTSPLQPPIPSLTQEIKSGVAFQIRGTARSPDFQSYLLEWALGSPATSGWSTAGFSLSDNGRSPVDNGVLGTWMPPASLKGDCSIRLTLTNARFTTTSTTTAIYVEPDIVPGGWPKMVGPIDYMQSALPVRQSDGSTRLVLCGYGIGARLYSFAYDGSSETVALDRGTNFQPCVGNLDGQPGDEIVVADGPVLKIFSSNLTLVRTILPDQPLSFGYDQICLADLDNDGVPEIIAPAWDGGNSKGMIYVFRADGSLFSNNYPRLVATGLGFFDYINAVTVDLAGDGRKEIILSIKQSNPTSYSLVALNADGTPYAGWTTLSFPGHIIHSLSAADLDGDGTSEFIINEFNQTAQKQQILVVNSTGLVRAGWPVVSNSSGVLSVAIGDLDRDQRNEIVVAGDTSVSVLRDNGSLWSQPWPIGDGTSFHSHSTPLIADIDHDGFPEVILSVSSVSLEAIPSYHFASLLSYRRDGGVQQNWPLYGMAERQPFLGVPLVGDFNGDGRTDLVVNLSLVEGGGINGDLKNTAITCLTTGTAFNGVASDWICALRDPQDSRTLNRDRSAPAILNQPVSMTAAPGFSVTFTVVTNGYPLPTYQWRKDGVNIAGATGSSYTLASVSLADAGSYTVFITNSSGSVTSNPATLATVVAAPSNVVISITVE